MPLCKERSAAIVVSDGFNSGMLATGAVEGAKYNYAPALAEIMDKFGQIKPACADHKVPLPAATLQFVVAQLKQNLRWYSQDIPGVFWAGLKHTGLLHEDTPVPA